MKPERPFTISTLEKTTSEALPVHLTTDQGPYTSVMSLFEVIKFGSDPAETEILDDKVHSGNPVVLKNLMNGLFLAVKKKDPKKIILEHLESEDAEFVFVFEKFNKLGNSTISYNEGLRIRSLNGGIVSLRL